MGVYGFILQSSNRGTSLLLGFNYNPESNCSNSVMKTLNIFRVRDKSSSSSSRDPANIFLFKVANGNIKKRNEICSNSTIKTPERRRYGVFIVNCKHVSPLFLAFVLLNN